MKFTAAIFDLIALEVAKKIPPKFVLITIGCRIKWKLAFNKHLTRNYTRPYTKREKDEKREEVNLEYFSVLVEICNYSANRIHVYAINQINVFISNNSASQQFIIKIGNDK